MIKEIVIGYLSQAPNPVLADRYYLRSHGPDVVRMSGPWLRRYESYKAYNPPPEAIERFGARAGRYTELWFNNTEEYKNRPKLIVSSPPPWERNPGSTVGGQALLAIPVLPTEEFVVQQIDPEKTTIMRWCCAIRYPNGVLKEDGENWYIHIHAPELARQPGLLGFYSYKGIEGDFMPPMVGTPKNLPAGPVGGSWVRYSELWYEDIDAWRKAVIEAPIQYTPPPWGGEFPFVEMISNFTDFKPDVDFLKGNYIIP